MKPMNLIRGAVIYFDEAADIPEAVMELRQEPPVFERIKKRESIRDDLAAQTYKAKRLKQTRTRKKIERKARRAAR